jgi:hypothetical protein
VCCGDWGWAWGSETYVVLGENHVCVCTSSIAFASCDGGGLFTRN